MLQRDFICTLNGIKICDIKTLSQLSMHSYPFMQERYSILFYSILSILFYSIQNEPHLIKCHTVIFARVVGV